MRAVVSILALLSALSIKAQDIIDEVSFSYDGITHLEVEGSFTRVEIKGVNGDQLKFDGKITGKSGKGDIEIKYEKSGSRLHVWIDRSSRYSSWNSNLKGELIFSVPKNIELNIDNSSGAVYAEQINASTCRLEASSGKVHARYITASTQLETSSGRITAEYINGNLKSKSSSGGQSLKNIKGNISSVASSGRISLENTEGQLNLRNSSGGIHGENVNIIGDSRLKSTSGSIKLELTQDIESYTYDCSASSGSIYIGDKKVGKSAYYKYGNILIEGVTSSGGQKYFN